MEVLTAFVREHSHEPWSAAAAGTGATGRLMRTDVEAAITVIARRDARRDRHPVDLYGAVLRGADLTGADLTARTSSPRTSAARSSAPQGAGRREAEAGHAIRHTRAGDRIRRWRGCA